MEQKKELSRTLGTTRCTRYYNPSCPYGKTDCKYDPSYIRSICNDTDLSNHCKFEDVACENQHSCNVLECNFYSKVERDGI